MLSFLRKRIWSPSRALSIEMKIWNQKKKEKVLRRCAWRKERSRNDNRNKLHEQFSLNCTKYERDSLLQWLLCGSGWSTHPTINVLVFGEFRFFFYRHECSPSECVSLVGQNACPCVCDSIESSDMCCKSRVLPLRQQIGLREFFACAEPITLINISVRRAANVDRMADSPLAYFHIAYCGPVKIKLTLFRSHNFHVLNYAIDSKQRQRNKSLEYSVIHDRHINYELLQFSFSFVRQTGTSTM